MRLRGVELGETMVEESIRRGQAFHGSTAESTPTAEAQAEDAKATESGDAPKEEASS